ncbi:hypothetical protein BKA70DRAFT_1193076 [Coprinopsis sp. MPI-PUGE-AT-0042]|nr:hypothetical protein BKA70DRAFT_1193076 [Coprinopsis sp. MPI-PUGE-AT-0042]
MPRRSSKSVAAQLKSLAAQFKSYSCPFRGCEKVCRNRQGLKQHVNSQHPSLSSDDSENEGEVPTTIQSHPILTATPVDCDGNTLPEYTNPPPSDSSPSEHPFAPFEDRLSFDWAHYHTVECGSSEAKINKGLDLWLATKVQATGNPDCEGLPWSSTQDLYKTVDEIQAGSAPFTTVHFQYSGLLPTNPPKWMTQKYDLCLRDTRHVIKNTLSTTDYAKEFNTQPYQQFHHNDDRMYSNLLSGDWAWREADKIAKDVPNSTGAMLVPVVSGLDKTTVSVATGHQEYHPFYISAGNLTNVARRGHSNSVMPVAFLPIPKTNNKQKKKKEYQRFVRQLYHTCIARIFEPLRVGMNTPEVVRCPDGHFRRAIYSIGPVIADYPEQVWLSGIVQGWCPKCDARPDNLDNPDARRRSRAKTDAAIQSFDPSILWTTHGIRDDIVLFTDGFPRADIHELMAPDLLHQVIKGTFKDHLVTWVMEYIEHVHGEAAALEIIADIDHRISAVPVYPGLRRFKEGRNFSQWTGDDSKALMKVYLAAIVGYVPDKMIQCMASFLELCYIFRRNAITTTALELAALELARFHELRKVFIETGTRSHCSLPRQHALKHFLTSIPLFGSPNGLCSSITESCHISAVKEPWRRSSRYNALSQMLTIITRLDKMSTFRRILARNGLLRGTTAMYTAAKLGEGVITSKDLQEYIIADWASEGDKSAQDEDDEDVDSRPHDTGPVGGPRLASSIKLAAVPERGYPKLLEDLALHIEEPQFPRVFIEYLYSARHPNRMLPPDIHLFMEFTSKIYVYHSAVARFYAASDACGVGGMQRQTIRCNPDWHNRARMDTVFVSENDEPGMQGMLIAQTRLLFSFTDPYDDRTHSCALVNWFPTVGDEPDPVTGMWVVKREVVNHIRPLQVIPLDAIVRGSHLLPDFGKGKLPDEFCYTDALDAFNRYFVNCYIDHHCHEMLTVI